MKKLILWISLGMLTVGGEGLKCFNCNSANHGSACANGDRTRLMQDNRTVECSADLYDYPDQSNDTSIITAPPIGSTVLTTVTTTTSTDITGSTVSDSTTTAANVITTTTTTSPSTNISQGGGGVHFPPEWRDLTDKLWVCVKQEVYTNGKLPPGVRGSTVTDEWEYGGAPNHQNPQFISRYCGLVYRDLLDSSGGTIEPRGGKFAVRVNYCTVDGCNVGNGLELCVVLMVGCLLAEFY